MSMTIRDTILLVDESTDIRESLRKILEEKYNILEARNNEQAMFLATQNHSSIASIIIGIELLAENNGVVVSKMKKSESMSSIPIIAIIPENDARSEYFALELGADETISHPFYDEIVDKRISNTITLHSHKWNLMHIIKEQEEILLHSNEVVVDALISTIESRSLESAQHILRIRRFTQILLETVQKNCPEYNLNDAMIRTISSAASLHDIGKISIPDAILNKPGKLTDEEFEIMKTHTTAGCVVIKRLAGMGNETYLRYAYNICRYHHERWDGRGYPDGLSGDEIPICAQVVGIADVYDALTTERVYKSAYSFNEAANMILRGDCGIFSPKLLECFKLVIGDFADLAKTYSDGYSPSADAITVPLDPPSKTADNAVQYMLSKYEVLLHHINATAVELDMDNGVFQVVYNPNPDLMILNNADSLDEAMRSLSDGNIIYPDDRTMVTEQFHDYLNTFFQSGVRKRVRRYRIKGVNGNYRYYDVTTLRINSDDDRKALIIWQPEEDVAASTELLEQHIDHVVRRAGLGGITVRIMHNRWLTVEGECYELCDMIGLSVEEFRDCYQNGLSSLILPSEYESLMNQLNSQLSAGINVELGIALYHKDGHIVWTILKGILAMGDNGVEYIHGMILDISKARDTDKVLREYLQYHRLAFDYTEDIPFRWDLNRNCMVISSKYKDRFSIGDDSSNNGDEYTVDIAQVHPDDISVLQEQIAVLCSNTRFTEFNCRIANNSRKYKWNRVRAVSRLDSNGDAVGILGVLIDVDNEQRDTMALIDSAERDSLTKLLNKETARRQIEVRLNNGKNESMSAMIIIDLDNFKEINDRYGHLFGDTLLVRVASEISWLFRGTDVTARIGGDEFLVFMNNVPHSRLVEQRCATLISSIENVCYNYTQNTDCSCSVGIAFSPNHGTAYQELFLSADRALYQAKRKGKRCYAIYDPNESSFITTTMVNRRIDSNEGPGMANNSLSHYVFNRLYESGNVEETIQSLLEIVGRQIGVSRVYIFENNSDDTTCSNTFEWCNDGVEPQKENLQNVSYETDIPDYEKNFNENGIFYVPDVSKLSKHLRDILEPQGICSIIHCAIRDNGRFRGYVGFDDNASVRLWTKEQIDILSFLGQIISVFLLKERVQDETERTLEDIRNVLNNQYSWTYVIEPDTFKLKFINKRTADLVPLAKTGDRCHKVFMNRDTPCPNCPIMINDGEKVSILDNTSLGIKVRAAASNIHWYGSQACLVMCREIDK